MKVALWAEIRRLAEIEKLSGWKLSSTTTLLFPMYSSSSAACWTTPPREGVHREASWMPRPDQDRRTISQVSRSLFRQRAHPRGDRSRSRMAIPGRCLHSPPCYVRTVRPCSRSCLPGGLLRAGSGNASRLGRVPRAGRGDDAQSLGFVAVLCYSRLIYIEFTLSQGKAESSTAESSMLNFFGGSPRAIIFGINFRRQA